MNYKITILLLTLLLGPLALSAKTFYPGYLLLKNGEKKEGLISYSPSRKNASTVYFKPNREAAEEEYNASGTSEFYIEPYATFFISIFEKATKKTVFTEVEIRGTLTLSTNHNLHVLSKKGDTLQLYLPVGKGGSVEDIESSGKLEARTNGLIKVFLADCLSDELNKLLSSERLNSSTLSHVVETYNTCKGGDVKRKKSHIDFGLIAGINIAMVKFENPIIDYFSPRPSYKAGITLDIVPSEYTSKLVLNVQLILAQNAYQPKSNAHPSFNDINLDNLTLRMPLSLKIFFTPGQTGFFINPGFSPFVVISPPTNKEGVVYYQVPSGVFLSYAILDQTFKLSTFGATLSMGGGWEHSVFSGKKVVTSMRYEYGIGSPYPSGTYSSSYSNIQVDVALKF